MSDDPSDVDEWRTAASEGVTSAMNSIAELRHAQGRDDDDDDDGAVYWWKLAASHGDSEAMLNLARLRRAQDRIFGDDGFGAWTGRATVADVRRRRGLPVITWTEPAPRESSPEGIKRTPAHELDPDIEEEWVRDIDDLDLCVSALRYPVEDEDEDEAVWQADVWAMSNVRWDPLESELREAIVAALRSVPGVTGIPKENDRGSWSVNGNPTGPGLVEALSDVVDRFADRIRSGE